MTAALPSIRLPVFRVLLVEDNPGDADLVRDALAGASDQIEIAHVDSLAKARERLAAGSVDVVLLDLSLPDATDLQGVERLHGAAPEIPIVVLTGHHDEVLGAHIAQSIAVAPGGSIIVNSELGRGATFLVRLPLEPPSNAGRSQSPS